jgi:hypothetical protein
MELQTLLEAKTSPVSPDIINPKNSSGEAVVISRPKAGFGGSPLIDKWAEAPVGVESIFTSTQDGKINWNSVPDGVESIFTSTQDGKINWNSVPDGVESIFTSTQDGKINWNSVPPSGNYIIAVVNGSITFIEAPPGDLRVLNNSLEWTGTESCDEES